MSNSALIDAAIKLSQILRTARFEASARPRIVGAIILALHAENAGLPSEQVRERINTAVHETIGHARGLSRQAKNQLRAFFNLSANDFSRLTSQINNVFELLKRLNIETALQSDADFLGLFYEAFLRHGYDNNALGIVFTPRHITQLCVDLTPVTVNDRVIDIACGTGGFLVSACDAMRRQATDRLLAAPAQVAFYGFDTNPTVWALASLNMLLRAGGKCELFNADCFDEFAFHNLKGRCTRAYLNPPFSQQSEPERHFIDRAMEALEPGGLLAAVVKAGIFADDEHKGWRQQFLKRHSLLAVISLPEDLFYPTAVPSSLIIARAHIPLNEQETIFLSRIWYDGYEKLKGRRVEKGNNQIPEIIAAYQDFQEKKPSESSLVTKIAAVHLQHGREWSPQEWLAQPETITEQELTNLQNNAMRSIFQAISTLPELAGSVLSNFGEDWSLLPPLPLHQEEGLEYFFTIFNGKSAGEKTYSEGIYPYVSSGDGDNSIIRLVSAEPAEIFAQGGLTVTAFGLARIQPWAFVARGNGGSSVRVLLPRYKMSFRELLWFVAQINAQRWRFFYARMAIKGRLARLRVWSPCSPLPDGEPAIAERVEIYQRTLDRLSQLHSETPG